MSLVDLLLTTRTPGASVATFSMPQMDPLAVLRTPQGLPPASVQGGVLPPSPPPTIDIPPSLYHNTPFALDITVSRAWRLARGIRPEDVWRAGFEAGVYLEAIPDVHGVIFGVFCLDQI